MDPDSDHFQFHVHPQEFVLDASDFSTQPTQHGLRRQYGRDHQHHRPVWIQIQGSLREGGGRIDVQGSESTEPRKAKVDRRIREASHRLSIMLMRLLLKSTQARWINSSRPICLLNFLLASLQTAFKNGCKESRLLGLNFQRGKTRPALFPCYKVLSELRAQSHSPRSTGAA